MAKEKTVYACTECGGQSLKWQGQCPHCQAWNTLEETIAEAAPAANRFALIAESGLKVCDMEGIAMSPTRGLHLSEDLRLNYLVAAVGAAR